MKIGKIIILLMLSWIVFISCKEKKNTDALHGVILFTKGDVKLEQNNGTQTTLKKGDVFQEGDIIQTGENSVAVVKLSNNGFEMEIQPNATFQFDKINGKDKSLSLKKGNVWLKVDKLPKDESLHLNSPTATAGVRGTKFYTFEMNGMYGTCHCEGDVEFKGKSGDYNKIHHGDTLVFSKDGKTILITPEDLKNIQNASHNHSMLDDSPLGSKNVMTPEQREEMIKVVTKKFAEAK
ncbi:MAG: FecR domain-containing protein [Leptospiraceae bacterium]|nr:FecR domain-containing protein [Leptospiraceae bacterium]MCP5496939.1 FecR domain-containing protein [Leptospiraceae bacterium]